MIRCTICGRENEDTFRYCLDCGTEITSPTDPGQEAADDDASLTPIPLTEEAPPTGMMPMQSAAVGPSAPPPSVSSATPPPAPRHTPAPPGALDPTSPSASSNPAAPAAPTAPTSVPDATNLAPPATAGTAPAVPAISAPGPAAPAAAAPDFVRPCATCGQEVAAGHVFCGSCGARADAPGPLPASPASTAAAAAAGGTMVMGAVDAPELTAPLFKVTVIQPDGTEARTVPLSSPRTVAGDASAAIAITDDPFVAADHLTLEGTGGVLRVKDGGSATGTFLKLSAGSPVPLPSGSALRFGRQRLRLDGLSPAPGEVPPGETKEWGSPDHGARYRLVQELEGGGDGTAWLLSEGDYRIGREQGELVFPGDGYVSGSHGKLQIGADGRASYEDLGSSNGSFLRLTTDTVVSAGDFLLVGMHLLRIDLQ